MPEIDYSIPAGYVNYPTDVDTAISDDPRSFLYGGIITNYTQVYIPEHVSGYRLTPNLDNGKVNGYFELAGGGDVNFRVLLHDTFGNRWYRLDITLNRNAVQFVVDNELNVLPGEMIEREYEVLSVDGTIITSDHPISNDGGVTWSSDPLPYIHNQTYVQVNIEAPASFNTEFSQTITVNDLTLTLTGVTRYPTPPELNISDIVINENLYGNWDLGVTDGEGDITYSLGGSDADVFEIDSLTGITSFKNRPNYEAPTDQNSDNVYQVTLIASNGLDSDSVDFTVTVQNIIDGANPVYVFDDVVGANPGEYYYRRAAISGIDDGVLLSSDVAEISNDGGVTWSTGNVVFVSGQTEARVAVRAPTAYGVTHYFEVAINNSIVNLGVNTKANDTAPVLVPDTLDFEITEHDLSVGQVIPTQGSATQWKIKSDIFDIDPNGNITVSDVDRIDFERWGNKYQVRVTAVDTYARADSCMVNIKVTNVLEDTDGAPEGYHIGTVGFRLV